MAGLRPFTIASVATPGQLATLPQIGSQVKISPERSSLGNDDFSAGIACSPMVCGVQPSLRWTDRSGRFWLEQEDLVHAHAENLPGDVLGGVGEQVGAHRRDLFRAHLLDLLDARLLRVGLGRDGADHAGPGERRHAVGADVEAAHVERDRLRQADDAELGGGVVGLAVIADQAGGRGEVDEGAALLLAENPRGGVAGIERAHQVDLDDGLERLDAHLVEDHVAQNAGVVDDAVEPAEVVGRGLDDLAGGNRFRHRLEVRNGRAAALLDLLDHFLGR